jgi:O-antigen/teichoic acid export membrane protein
MNFSNLSDLKNKITSSKFSKDTFWLIGSQGILLVSGLLVNLLIGKKLGASELGVFNQVLGYYTVFSTIFSLGLNNSIIKSVSALNGTSNSEKYDKILFSSNFILTSISSILFTLGFILVALNCKFLFSSKEVSEAIVIPFISLPFYNMNKNFMAYYTAKRMQKQFSIVRSFRWVFIILYITTVLIFTSNVNYVLYAFLFAEVILFIFSFYNLFNILTLKINFHDLKENFLFGLKSFSAEIFAVFNDKFDILIIGYFLTNNEVGVYSFFIFFAKAMYIFPGILQQNLSPIISKHWAENTMNILEIKMKKVLKINLIILLLQFLFTLLFYYILIIYFKKDFQNTFHLLAITLIGVFPSALISWSGSLLVMTGKLKENLIRTFIIMFISIITTFVFTYTFGLIGATIAVSLSSIISVTLMYLMIKKVLGIRIV